ncbi:MAG TPA: ABC transporter ATP-binding protein, partial [Cytophagaceae bacterium]
FKYKYRLLLGILFVILNNVTGIFQAPVTREVINFLEKQIKLYFTLTDDQVRISFREEFATQIMMYGIMIISLALLSGIFLYFQRRILIGMSRYIEFDLKNEIYDHYQKLPLSFYKKQNTGDLMNRISEDVNQVRNYLGPAIMYGLNLLALFSISITLMLWVSPKLTLYVMIPLPILTLSIYLVQNLITKRSERIQKELSDLSTYVQEAFSGIRVVKSFVREKDSINRFINASEKYREQSLKLTRVDAFFFPLILALTGLSTIIIVFVGGMEVINGNLTYGNIAEFIIYLNKLTWPVASLGWITSMVQRAEASQKRINEFLKTKSDIISTENSTAPIQGTISFKDVTFSYPDSGITALKNITFEVKAGESVGIIGNTGSGKSSMANLICRLYDSTSGNIFIDDKNIKDYNINYLRSNIGYVPQDVFLFSESIRNNIAFGAIAVTEEEIIQAAKDADLYDNIQSFPEGFDTIIGERGITLSGGQKQRLSIARALVRQPKILILDDSLSAVDTKTETAILNRLKVIMVGKTSLIISHRVSSVKLANKIIVLQDGAIIEEGSHDELLALGGAYASLYQKQLKEETKEVE